MDLTLQHNINSGEVDVNNTQLFISTLFKSLLNDLDSRVKLRNKSISHFMLNTGDDIMWLEHKGQDMSKEPLQVSNEDYVYNMVPRCMVNMNDLEVLEEQITSPYNRGNFEIEHDDMLYGFNAEFRRAPLKLGVSLKYYLDSFTDVITVTQYLITKMLFIRTFKFDYMGQTIEASYKVPTSFSHEKNITFDGGTTEQKLRTIELTLELETNMPIFNERTAIENDLFIKKFALNENVNGINPRQNDEEKDYVIK